MFFHSPGFLLLGVGLKDGENAVIDFFAVGISALLVPDLLEQALQCIVL